MSYPRAGGTGRPGGALTRADHKLDLFASMKNVQKNFDSGRNVSMRDRRGRRGGLVGILCILLWDAASEGRRGCLYHVYVRACV